MKHLHPAPLKFVSTFFFFKVLGTQSLKHTSPLLNFLNKPINSYGFEDQFRSFNLGEDDHTCSQLNKFIILKGLEYSV